MLTTIVAAIIVLGGLIFFHELGHFTVARWLGMGVSTFSLGFGPKLLKYRHGKTEYALSLVPLGGYVALVGENDENDIPSGFTREECFSLRPAWQRFLVIAAGPFANILLACILCWVVAWGWGNTVMLPQVGTVMPQSAAAQAGLQKGDLILSIDGQALSSWDEISPTVAAANGRPLILTVARQPAEGMTQGTELELTLTPQWSTRKTIFGEDEKAWLIGIGPLGSVRVEELGFAEALETGLVQTWRLVDLTWQSFVKLAQRVVPADQVGGPIMIAQMVGQQAEQGLVGVLGLAALISINLAILNLLPVPVLDGGQMLFCLIEMIFRRPVPQKIQEWGMRVGMALLLSLMIFATFNDVTRIINTPDEAPAVEKSLPSGNDGGTEGR